MGVEDSLEEEMTTHSSILAWRIPCTEVVTADHGNDPTWYGTDHTREKIPLLMFSKSLKNGRYLDERTTFGDIGATILKNFGLEKPENLLGSPIEELFE